MESLCLSEPSFEFKARPVPKSVRRPRAPPAPMQHKELTTPVCSPAASRPISALGPLAISSSACIFPMLCSLCVMLSGAQESPNLATRLRSACRPQPSLDPAPLPSFKAAPAPDFSRTFFHAARQERPALTEPEPFRLSTDERHRVHQEELRRRVETEVLWRHVVRHLLQELS